VAQQIKGLNEALETLRKVDPRLYREGQKMLRKRAKPLVDAARSGVPRQSPLSGWKVGEGSGAQRSGASRFPAWETSAQRKINLRVRRERVSGMGGRRVLVRVVQGSAAGAVFDMAGRKNRGNRIDKSLQSAGYGSASRSMWPAAEANLQSVERGVREAVEEMEKYINSELRKNPRLPLGS
jgi:hypothetical protein